MRHINTSTKTNKLIIGGAIAGIFSAGLALFSFAGGPDPMAMPTSPPLIMTGKSFSQFLQSTPHEWQPYVGLSYIDPFNGTKNKTFSVTSIETDLLHETSRSGSVGATFGFDRTVISEKNNKFWGFIDGISYGAMFHLAPTRYSGDVYQFQSPAFNNYTYNYDVETKDFAADASIYILKMPKLHLLPYVITGVGFSLVDLAYTNTPRDETNTQTPAATGSELDVTPLLLVGAGAQWNISDRYLMKMQYMYHYRGNNVATTVGSFSGRVPVGVNEQSVDVVAGVRFS